MAAFHSSRVALPKSPAMHTHPGDPVQRVGGAQAAWARAAPSDFSSANDDSHVRHSLAQIVGVSWAKLPDQDLLLF